MDQPLLAHDFKEFLRLLNSKGVEYLLVGDYAVGYYGYPRTTDQAASGRPKDLDDLQHL